MGTKLETATGVVLAPVAYYVASLGSALWISGEQNLVVAAIIISMALFAGLCMISYLRAYVSVALSVTVLFLLAISLLLGGIEYSWIAPLPLDIASLFLHGSHTPLVYCVVASTLASGLMKLQSQKKVAKPSTDLR